MRRTFGGASDVLVTRLIFLLGEKRGEQTLTGFQILSELG